MEGDDGRLSGPTADVRRQERRTPKADCCAGDLRTQRKRGSRDKTMVSNDGRPTLKASNGELYQPYVIGLGCPRMEVVH